MLIDLVTKNRSYRRFDESHVITEETLRALVNLARLSASGANKQPLAYLLSYTPEQNARIFPHIAWAGALPDWSGPAEGERPSAYIAILVDTRIAENPGLDPGIAAQSILLGATEQGLGGCMLGNIKRAKLQEVFNLPAHYAISLLIALGKPNERVVLEPIGAGGASAYYREGDVHHVPKRALDDIIVSW